MILFAMYCIALVIELQSLESTKETYMYEILEVLWRVSKYIIIRCCTAESLPESIVL